MFPMPSNPWPHDMTIRIEDNPHALLDLLWTREAWQLHPEGDDLPPLLTRTPPPVDAALRASVPAVEWQDVWPDIWHAALGHYDVPVDEAQQRLAAPGLDPAERGRLLDEIVGPTWRDRSGTAAYIDGRTAWLQAHAHEAVRHVQQPLHTQPERTALAALVPAWRAGLETIVEIPGHAKLGTSIEAMSNAPPVVLVDGKPADTAGLLPFVLSNDAHFTAMQVRGGAVRGVDLHLNRLTAAHQRLYRSALNIDRVRELMHDAVHEHADCYLRVTVTQVAERLRVLTVVRPPVDASRKPVALESVRWTRGIPEVKHAGTFPQLQLAREAERNGFDDALLVTPEGFVSETTIANIGFVRGHDVVWPTTPALQGITQMLLAMALPDHGFSNRNEPVRLADVASFETAVLSNSIGIEPVERIDGHTYSASPMARVFDEIYQSLPVGLL